MKKSLTLIVLLLLALCGLAQQDPQYNLYQFNQMVINPAYAGARDGISTVASVRNQWSGFSDLRTTCLSAHTPIMDNKVGVGLTVVNDKMGPRKFTGAYANAAYILKLNSKYKLSFGLGAGFNQYKFDYTKIDFNTTEIPNQFYQVQSKGILDLNTGLFLRSNSFFVGLSFTHLTSPSLYDYSSVSATSGSYSYNLRSHSFLTIGKSFIINENVIFAPTVLLKSVKGNGQLDINLNFFLYKKLWLGLFVKSGYGPGFLLQYYITNKFKVAYSFDTGSKDARRLGASHELMIGYDFSLKKPKMAHPRFL